MPVQRSASGCSSSAGTDTPLDVHSRCFAVCFREGDSTGAFEVAAGIELNFLRRDDFGGVDCNGEGVSQRCLEVEVGGGGFEDIFLGLALRLRAGEGSRMAALRPSVGPTHVDIGDDRPDCLWGCGQVPAGAEVEEARGHRDVLARGRNAGSTDRDALLVPPIPV